MRRTAHKIASHIKKVSHLKHLLFIILIGVFLLGGLLVLGNLYFEKVNPVADKITYGVSFSPNQARGLGLDPHNTYLKILDDLGVKHLRVSAPWKDIELTPKTYNFSEVDFMLQEAEKRRLKVIIVLGLKQPRWPECQAPAWAHDLPVEKRQQYILRLIKEVVLRYKDNPAVWAWQVENEPLFPFGDKCDAIERNFLKTEVSLVRVLDDRPVIVTDSGELRPWRTPMRLSDIFGTTLYRTVYSEIFGYIYWPLPPAFYNIKSTLARQFFAPKNTRTIIIELQAEPWSPLSLSKTPLKQQLQLFSLKNLKDNIEFGKRTGFDEIYLWGAEWWYFMQRNGHPEYLEAVKKIF